MSDLFCFSDEQWAGIAPTLPKKMCGSKCVDDRRVMSGIVHVLIALPTTVRWSPPIFAC